MKIQPSHLKSKQTRSKNFPRHILSILKSVSANLAVKQFCYYNTGCNLIKSNKQCLFSKLDLTRHFYNRIPRVKTLKMNIYRQNIIDLITQFVIVYCESFLRFFIFNYASGFFFVRVLTVRKQTLLCGVRGFLSLYLSYK